MTERREKIYVVTPHMYPLHPVFCRRSDSTEEQDDREKLLEEEVSKNNPLVIPFHEWLKKSYLPNIMTYLHFIIQNPIQYLEVTKKLSKVIGVSVDIMISHDTFMSSFMETLLPNYNDKVALTQRYIAGDSSLQSLPSPDVYSTCTIPASSGMFFSIKDILTKKKNNSDFDLFLELIYEILKLRLHVTTFPTIWSTMQKKHEKTPPETTRREDVENFSLEKYAKLHGKQGFEKFYERMQRMDVKSALDVMRREDLNYHTDEINVMYSACCARILAASLCEKVGLKDDFKTSDLDSFGEFWKKNNRSAGRHGFSHNVGVKYWYDHILPDLYDKLVECGAIEGGTNKPKEPKDPRPSSNKEGGAPTLTEEEEMAAKTLLDLRNAEEIVRSFDGAPASRPHKKPRDGPTFSTRTMVQNLMAQTAQMHIH